MFQPRSLVTSALVAWLAFTAPHLEAQEPSPRDSIQARLNRLGLPLLLSRPTLVGLYPYTVFDSAARFPAQTAKAHPELPRLARLADSLGFDFVLRPPETATIQDQRYAAVYHPPTGQERGFILFAPGLRPTFVSATITEADLAQELRDLRIRASRLSYRAS